MINPLVVEKQGRKLAVLTFSDIDGTVNDQKAAEKDRLKTIDPAKEAIKLLQNNGIPVGLITARSFGETLVYKNALNTQGFIISEDGALVILPELNNEALNDLAKNNHVVSHENENALILSKIEIVEIKNFFNFINKILKENSSDELITSCTSSPELLKELINYETLEDAKRATDRLTSAFVRNSSDKQFNLIKKYAGNWGMRATGDQHHFHVLGSDADKGGAIQFINKYISMILSNKNIDGIFPIVFGNDYNDLRLFEEAYVMGGIGIIVKDSNNEYKVSEEKIPDYVIKTDGAFGYGMQEAVEIVLKKITN